MKQEHEMTPGVLVSDGKIPDVLVPSVATREMKDAALAELERQGFDCQDFVVQPVYQAMLAAAPAPVERVGQEAEDLDNRLRAAGMYSVADLLRGAPLDGFIKHAGVHNIESLVKWAEMRRAECLSALARYDLGDKSKDDELYEWTVAHCAVFAELHVNLRAATETPQPAPAAVQDVGQLLNDLFEFLESSGIDPGNDIALRLAAVIEDLAAHQSGGAKG